MNNFNHSIDERSNGHREKSLERCHKYFPKRDVKFIVNRQKLQQIINLPVRIVRFSGDALTKGIEQHLIDDVPVKVYNPSKTVADCFKYRNKIGLDVALESLRACRQSKKCSHEELWYYAKICRVTNVMRPYLEFIT